MTLTTRTSMFAAVVAAVTLAASGCETLGVSSGREACAQPNETLALKAAAVQQQLMVAALYCHDVRRYNRFVLSYRKELQASDAALLRYFRRANGGSDAGYHAYKTRLANTFSIAGSRGKERLCSRARSTFDAALGGRHRTLAAVVSALPDARDRVQPECARMASR